MSIPYLPIHPHPQRLMSKTYRRRLRRQQAGVRAPQGGPDFVSPEDQFRMSLDTADGPAGAATLAIAAADASAAGTGASPSNAASSVRTSTAI